MLKDDIPDLLGKLSRVRTEYDYEKGYVGEAISCLRVLYDMLAEKEKKENVEILS